MGLPAHITWIRRGVLHSNSVVVHAEDHFALIDSGYYTGAEALECAIGGQAQRRLDELSMVVNTHAHPDHTGGNAYLQQRARCAIVMSDVDSMLVESGDPVTLMREWSDLECPSFQVTHSVHPGETLRLGKSEFVVVEGSGHSAGEVCYYSPADKLLVCGDALWQSGFSNVVPLVEGVGGLARHRRTLRGLRALDVEVAIPGHGALIVGAASFRERIDQTIAKLEFYSTHRESWMLANLKGFLVMHVLVQGTPAREAFLARCERSAWYREQVERLLPDAAGLLPRLLDELIAQNVLSVRNDHVSCNLRA